MPSRIDAATECFKKGFNCAQAVFSAYAPDVGVKEEDALRIGTAFGGGMGRQQEVCGAVTGAYMVIGAKCGMIDSTNVQAKETAYALVNDFTRRFRELHGSIICLDLLGTDMNTEEGRQQIAEKKLFTLICLPCVEDACKILETAVFVEADAHR
jgi:C_GCAxxG_C_C family probable redox protein